MRNPRQTPRPGPRTTATASWLPSLPDRKRGKFAAPKASSEIYALLMHSRLFRPLSLLRCNRCNPKGAGGHLVALSQLAACYQCRAEDLVGGAGGPHHEHAWVLLDISGRCLSLPLRPRAEDDGIACQLVSHQETRWRGVDCGDHRPAHVSKADKCLTRSQPANQCP
jgi:hypothetical protein